MSRSELYKESWPATKPTQHRSRRVGSPNSGASLPGDEAARADHPGQIRHLEGIVS